VNGDSPREPGGNVRTRTGQTAQTTPFSSPPAVDLHIEELVLHGFAAHDRYRIAQAVEGELARLLAERGVSPALARGGEIESLDGGSFDVAADDAPETVGAQVAQALLGRFAR
jgi:hypothetical protein